MRLHRSLALAIAALLAACGSPDTPPSTASSGSSKQQQASRNAAASAEEVAKESRGKVKCPAKVARSERPAGAPVDDVVGVRAGMTYEEAANVVMCSRQRAGRNG